MELKKSLIATRKKSEEDIFCEQVVDKERERGEREGKFWNFFQGILS